MSIHTTYRTRDKKTTFSGPGFGTQALVVAARPVQPMRALAVLYYHATQCTDKAPKAAK